MDMARMYGLGIKPAIKVLSPLTVFKPDNTHIQTCNALHNVSLILRILYILKIKAKRLDKKESLCVPRAGKGSLVPKVIVLLRVPTFVRFAMWHKVKYQRKELYCYNSIVIQLYKGIMLYMCFTSVISMQLYVIL